MREISYKKFSLKTHQSHSAGRPLTACQFELTFRCSLRCKYCYCACYNTPAYSRKELTRKAVEKILRKLRASGVFWLCLTGGDPLARSDFPEIYACAKNQGFLITIFTSAAQLSEKAFKFLKENPPFLVEITLNALDERLYERICGVKGAYSRVMANLRRLKNAHIPVKIKTQVIRDNIDQVPLIKGFAAEQGFDFLAVYDLYPRLNGDTSVCGLRVAPDVVIDHRKEYGPDPRCFDTWQRETSNPAPVYLCSVGSGKSIYVDPLGRAFLCPLIRNTDVNLQKTSVRLALAMLKPLFLNKKYSGESACRGCSLSGYCLRCPGEAYLEAGDIEAPISYYCELTKRLFTVKEHAR
jgi:MoaA/NifB/PqqE/SkfB family radical SAM enzyme